MSLIASSHLLLEPSTAFQSQLSNTGWGQRVTCFSPPLPSKQFSLQSSCFVKQEPFPAPALQVVKQQRKARPPGSPMDGLCRPSQAERGVHATVWRGSLCQTREHRWLPAPIPRSSHRGYNADGVRGNLTLVCVEQPVVTPVSLPCRLMWQNLWMLSDASL